MQISFIAILSILKNILQDRLPIERYPYWVLQYTRELILNWAAQQIKNKFLSLLKDSKGNPSRKSFFNKSALKNFKGVVILMLY